MEVLYSAKTQEDLITTRKRRELAYEWVELTDAIFERAMDIPERLAKNGHHRIPIPDVIVATAAEQSDLTVIHYDGDYDRISNVANVETEWVVASGSID